MVKSKEESFMMINDMALSRLQMKMVSLIGGNNRMVREKDMEHLSFLMETDTRGNTCIFKRHGYGISRWPCGSVY
jgi:hypothetical protein